MIATVYGPMSTRSPSAMPKKKNESCYSSGVPRKKLM